VVSIIVVTGKPEKKMTTDGGNGELIVYVTYISAVRKTQENCRALLSILDNHRIKYTKVDIGVTPERREQMIKGSGKATLPQVFVDDLFIGGFEEIEDWNENENLLQALKEAGYKNGDDDEPPPPPEDE
jgi:glutaredoxin 3